MFSTTATRTGSRSHTDDADGPTLIACASEEESRDNISVVPFHRKSIDLVTQEEGGGDDDNDDDDDDDEEEEEDEDDIPVVIVPLVSHAATLEIHNKNNTGAASMSVDGVSPGWSSSPLALSLSAKKKRALIALAFPFMFAVMFRILHNNALRLPPAAPVTLKVIDVNSPPVDLPEGLTISNLMEETTSTATTATSLHDLQQKEQEEHHHQQQHAPPFYSNNPLLNAPTASFRRSASLKIEEGKESNSIPVVVDRGEKIPVGVGGKKVSAAEALMCRESVINYVINATNGKDECAGLQKAFDETCSQEDEDEDEVVVSVDGGASGGNIVAGVDSPQTEDGNEILLGQRQPDRYRRRGRSRRLQEFTQQERAKELQDYDWLDYCLYQISRYAQAILDWIPWFERPKFNAPNAVYRLYPRAKRRILKRKNHHRHNQQRELQAAEGELQAAEVLKDGAAIMEEDDDPVNDDDDESTTVGKEKNTTTPETKEEEPQFPIKVKQHKPHTSLQLPTGQAHVSGKTLEKTLLLQNEDKIISDLKKAAANATNATKVSATIDPKEDAHASSKAVADTSDLVSAVLNDPMAIEARACCTSIMNVYHENCNIDAEEDISDKRLFIVVLIMAFCGMVKSLIRHFKIRWLPEAAGCILVGVASGYAASFFPHQDFSFDGNWFLRILVPPIVFEAALSIDKKAFNRHLVPILIYSTAGTLLATVLTASIVYNGTLWLGRFCETIPYIESLIFGSLISSIDPIAVLSVLSNMGMTDTDTLYVLVFGESLLNDGVAIVLFETLVQFLDASVVIDRETIMSAVIHFCVVVTGSLLIGIGSGIMCTLYYWGFHGCQTPLVECLMFLCWALLPYYVCDGIGWSGIVSTVTVGFVMDMYVTGVGDSHDDMSEHSHHAESMYYEDEKKIVPTRARPIFSGEGHLSAVARIHIGFVTEIVATMMETAIFAYLGLFLFSHRYHWNAWHVLISIFACCLSRAIMIPILSAFANWITSMQKYQNKCRGINKNSPATGVIVDKKMQYVLWFAGLRGAMSFALVEHIPLFDAVTGEGTRLKAELKAMTSASIMFTVFVLGGSTNYFMDYVGLSPASVKKGARNNPTNMELVPLTTRPATDKLNGASNGRDSRGLDNSAKSRKTRQRVKQKDDPER